MTKQYTVLFRTIYGNSGTHSEHDTRDAAVRAARKASKGDGIAHTDVMENQVEWGPSRDETPWYPIMHGAWRWGRKVA